MGSIKRKFGNNITSGKFDATDLTGTIPASNVANASLTSVTALPGISGDFIQTVASDPPAPSFGDVWYNSTEQKVKTLGLSTASWASGGNMSTARRLLAGTGTQTAGLCFGGYSPPNTNMTNTEEYDGASWTTVSSMATTRYLFGGAGTQTEALGFGGNSGSITNVTEEWTVSAFTAKTITTA